MKRHFMHKTTFIASITVIVFAVLLTTSSGVNAVPNAATVSINGADSGRTFEGEGVLSGGGGNSKLLYDYPEPYRSEILDYLFKPNFGASYQELKVEIGADVNSTSGTEPSQARTLAENSNPNMVRGYETWMLREAKNRNPSITTYGLEWGAPGWTGDFYSQNNANYLVSYIKGLKSVWGIDLDYIAANQNESFNGTSVQARDYIVNTLRPTLNSNGLSAVKIVAPDILSTDWAFANQVVTDSALKSAVAAIGYHYVNSSSTSNAQNSGLPIWESEGWTGIGDWNGAFSLAKEMNLNYINGKMTKTDVWHAIESAYNNTNWAHSGIMEANTPWSGYYMVQPAVWAAAHTTQFAQPGWKYLDSGCGITPGGASYVTLKKPDTSGNYSIVIVSGGSTESFTVNLSGGLATTPVHVWKSNSSIQFIQQTDITVSGSAYTISLEPNSIYTLTTTTGQQKGVAAHAIPANTSLSNTYSDNYESYAIGATPRYTQDTEGAFEVSSRYGGGGNALRQVIIGPLLQWNSWGNTNHPSAFTEFGSLQWQNYDFSSDILIENSGAAAIYGRVGAAQPGGNVNDYKGYRLSIYASGAWYLCYGDAWTYETSSDSVLASGTASGFTANTWHNLKLSFSGSTIKAYIDNTVVATVTNSMRSTGMAGLGSGWNYAQFDNINIAPIAGVVGAGSYDDQNYSGFAYNGNGWNHDGGGCAPGCYNGTNSWDNTANDYTTVIFSGTQIKFYGVKDPGHGMGMVSIDGGGEVPVDFYAATRAGNQLLWTSPTLSNTVHSFKLRVTGTKNTSSSSTWVVPDRVDVIDGGISATAWYNVINQNSNKCADAAGRGTTDGTKLIQWGCGTGANQQWQFQPTDSGYYKVLPRYSTVLVWAVTGGAGATGDSTPVELRTYSGGTNQQWQPIAVGGGYYKFIARNSGKCLEVPAWSTADNTQLTQYSCNGGANQSFRLVQQP